MEDKFEPLDELDNSGVTEEYQNPEENRCRYPGNLHIDYNAGTIEFRQYDYVLLRITHVPVPIPRTVTIDIAAISALTSYTNRGVLVSQQEARERSMSIHPSTGIYTDVDDEFGSEHDAGKFDEDDICCEVCHHVHEIEDMVKVGDDNLIIGHEYEITTKTSMQRYPRLWRMGFAGRGIGGLTFSARGPDRTHSGQYGGTQTIDKRDIVNIEEVTKDEAKRYVGRRAEGK